MEEHRDPAMEPWIEDQLDKITRDYLEKRRQEAGAAWVTLQQAIASDPGIELEAVIDQIDLARRVLVCKVTVGAEFAAVHAIVSDQTVEDYDMHEELLAQLHREARRFFAILHARDN